MATAMIKSTYALDPETVAALERMAERWGVSKSEALRRAIRAAACEGASETNDPLEAWAEFQESVGLRAGQAQAWAARTRAQRRDSSGGREARRK